MYKTEIFGGEFWDAEDIRLEVCVLGVPIIDGPCNCTTHLYKLIESAALVLATMVWGG